MWLNLTIIESMDDFCDTIPPAIYVLVIGIKSICTFYNRETLLKLFDLLEKLENEAIHSKQEKQILQRSLHNTKYLFVGLGSLNMASVTGLLLLVLLNSERGLIWPALYPFDWQGNAYSYYAILTAQYVTSMHYSLLVFAIEVYGPSLFILLSSFLEILGNRLRALGTSNTSMSNWNNEEKLRYNEHEMIGCIKLHQLCNE